MSWWQLLPAWHNDSALIPLLMPGQEQEAVEVQPSSTALFPARETNSREHLQLPWSPPEKLQFLMPDLTLTVGKVPLSQVSLFLALCHLKYIQMPFLMKAFYFILKYHEWYFSHLLKEIHQTLKTEETTVKATNTEISTKQMLKKTKTKTKDQKLNFLLKAWDISKTST